MNVEIGGVKITKVNCLMEACAWNKNKVCIKDEIELNPDGECCSQVIEIWNVQDVKRK